MTGKIPDVLFKESSNPNADSQLNQTEWKRTPVRPRLPE